MELYRYKATVTHIVDGDTVDLLIDLGFDTFRKVRVRFADINTPEIHGVKHSSDEYAQGMKAKQFVEEWLEDYNYEVLVRTYQERGNFRRWIGEIWSPDGDKQLNNLLIKTGHALPYDGG